MKSWSLITQRLVSRFARPAWLPRRRNRRRSSRGLGFRSERLEERALLTTFTVTNLLDSGAGSLRAAVSAANSNPGADTVNFQAGLTGTITLTTLQAAPDGGTFLLITDTTGATTIQGPTTGGGITIDGLNQGRLFWVNPTGASSGVAFDISDLTLTRGAFNGSAIANYRNNNGTLTVTNMTITDCLAGNGSGAINSTGLATISNSTFTGNRGTYAGAIVDGGTMTVQNSTISGNYGTLIAGGILAGGNTTIVNSTITRNTGSSGAVGSGVFTNAGSPTLKNTIVAGNTNGVGGSADLFGTNFNVANSVNNLIGSASSAGGFVNGVNGNIVGNNGSGTIPIANILNTTLANNGGPTLTHALVAGSPALDKGSNAASNAAGLTTDQRGPGYPRIGGSFVDIGAFELVTITNSPPAVAANASAVSASEGGTATNTGTFSDPQGNSTVIVTASIGTVTQNNTTGTWNWSLNAADGPAGPFTVTVTATDNQSMSATTNFTYSINNVAPTAADDAVISLENGLAQVVDVLANDSDTAGANDPLSVIGVNTTGTKGAVTLSAGQVSYSSDGFFESLGAGETDLDSFEYTISDGDGGTDTGTVMVTITGQNDAPTAVGSIANVVVNQNAANTVISLAGLFSDVDANDTLTITASSSSAGLVTTSVASGSLTLDYQANQSGTATITVTGTDSSGASASLTFTVQVRSPQMQADGIKALIQQWKADGKINSGIANSMTVKVENALKSYDKGNLNAAEGQLGALKNEINAKVKPGGLTSADATLAISLIDALYDSMTP